MTLSEFFPIRELSTYQEWSLSAHLILQGAAAEFVPSRRLTDEVDHQGPRDKQSAVATWLPESTSGGVDEGCKAFTC